MHFHCFLLILSLNILFTSTVFADYNRIDISLIPATKEKIQDITNKIDKITHNLLLRSSSQNKDYILNNLEKKLLKAARHLGSIGEKHVQTIMEGIRLKAFNNTEEDDVNVVEENTKSDLSKNNYRSVRIPLVDNFSDQIESFLENELEKVEDLEKKQNILDQIKEKLLESVSKKQNEIMRTIENENITRRRIDHNEAENTDDKNQDTLYQNINNPTSDYHTSNNNMLRTCYEIDIHTCKDIKNINKLKCSYDLGYITLDKLCDGTPDCPSKSDEKNCVQQVIDRVQLVEEMMDNIELLLKRKCLHNYDRGFGLSSQDRLVQNVVQRRFILKEKYNLLLNTKNNTYYESSLKEGAHEIALILSALALTVDGSLCSQKSEFDTRKSNDYFKINLKTSQEPDWPPKDCRCVKDLCFNCSITCKRVCWQKYSLTKWNCESLNNTSIVSLDALCDGKLDCFDESDERNCVFGTGYAKFDASEKFSSILDMLHIKASKERLRTQKKILYLISLIKKLQQRALESMPKQKTIRRLRNKCYSTLSIIYSGIMNQSTTVVESGDAYSFLLAINQDLGTALKRSQTGNIQIIKGNECDCINGTCSFYFCSKICTKACAAQLKLMKYYCKGENDKAIDIQRICDGVDDCLYGNDELNCKKDEICRRHHLVVLRHKLQAFGENWKGTAMGELLSTWKTKVVSILRVAEKNERPTPKVMKTIVENILQDLVLTFGSVRDYKRSNTEYALDEFLLISQMILDSLKTCRK